MAERAPSAVRFGVRRIIAALESGWAAIQCGAGYPLGPHALQKRLTNGPWHTQSEVMGVDVARTNHALLDGQGVPLSRKSFTNELVLQLVLVKTAICF